MDGGWILAGSGDRLIRLTRLGADGKAMETVGPLLTVRTVSRRLRKSRRQVYRYFRTGRLTPCGRVLGQWLVAASELKRLARDRVPASLRPWFWDVPLSSLSRERHRDFILGRLLESGDWDAVRWALRSYQRDRVAAFLQRRGADVLSRRAWSFWASQLGVKGWRRAPVRWRHQGRRWGGLAVPGT